MNIFSAQVESNQSLNILITGVAVVFGMLLLLIGIIKLYSTIVSSVQNRKRNPEETKAEKITSEAPVHAVAVTSPSDDSVDLAVVAVISAAVEAYYAESGVPHRVTGIRRVSSTQRNEWSYAGLNDNIFARRFMG
ncbi:MAG: OadG family transporter subunit [Ruminococcus sp.]